MISAIVAVDNNFGIGCKDELLVSIPNDLKRFKTLTTGNTVIMGRKTWESLPIKPLPNRTNCVVTHGLITTPEVWTIDMDEAKAMCRGSQSEDNPWDDIFIIGGGQIYKELLSYCDRIYLTRIHKEFDKVDTYFPNFTLDSSWKITSLSPIMDWEDFTYQFEQYDRI